MNASLASAAPSIEPTLGEIHEVRRLGARDSAYRTADQTAAALFWHCAPATLWSEAAGVVLGAVGESAELSRGLALVSQALAQVPGVMSSQAAQHPVARPIALIRGEAPSRLAATSIDPSWEPLVRSKHAAGFPSIACVRTGVVVGLLRAILGDDGVPFSITHDDLGVTRSFENLSAMLQEVEDSKIWGGTHVRPVAVESTELGLDLAREFYRAGGSPSNARTSPDSRA